MEALVTLIENVAGFIWGGTWGDSVVIPGEIGPLAIVLLGTGLFVMIRHSHIASFFLVRDRGQRFI